MEISASIQNIHDQAVDICKRLERCEIQLLQTLQIIDHKKVFKYFGYPSLFKYTVEALSLSEPVAYSYISVARAAKQFPVLGLAVKSGELSVYKASRLIRVLDESNSVKMVSAAKKMKTREIEKLVASHLPKTKKKDVVRLESSESSRVSISVSRDILAKVDRVKDLNPKLKNFEDVLRVLLEDYLKRKDPVERAQRNAHKVTKLCAHRVSRRREPLSAAVKHQVHLRDGGQCTHVGQNGERCDSRRWLHIHHIQPVSAGGSNELSNLATLCSAHHDLVHQMSFPLDGQVTWLRESVVAYTV